MTIDEFKTKLDAFIGLRSEVDLFIIGKWYRLQYYSPTGLRLFKIDVNFDRDGKPWLDCNYSTMFSGVDYKLMDFTEVAP